MEPVEKRGIIFGRHSPGKRELARQFRRTLTPAEQKLWASLRGSKLNGLHFPRQQVIDGFIVDFYCHEAGLIVEVDGLVHESQLTYDAERSRILAARGLRVLRFSNQRVFEAFDAVLNEISIAATKS